MKKTRVISTGIAFVFAITLTLHAQTATVSGFNDNIAPVQLAQTDSIVGLVAEEQGLQLVPSDQVPLCGTFWMVLPGPGGITAPFPCPPLDPSLPIYAIADGQFLVDGTSSVQATLNTPQAAGRQATSSTSAAALEVQANAVVTLITRVQTAAANQQMRTMARAMGLTFPRREGMALAMVLCLCSAAPSR